MRDNTRGRATAAVIATAALAMLAAGCSGGHSSASGPSSPGGSTSSPSAVAYSACMRSHGVPDFPDPEPGSAHVPKTDAQSLRVNSAQLQTAQTACQSLYPDNGSFEQQTEQCMLSGDCPQVLVQRILAAEQPFAQCMRSHGVADWPDPTVDSSGRPLFALSNVPGHDRSYWHSPQMTALSDECERLTGGAPVPIG